jgi:DHA2 family methylenomycin A resistance protein-like MFS transporter
MGFCTNLGAETAFMDMLPGFVVVPAGLGLAVPAMTTAILSRVDRTWSATASAALNAARQVGGAMGVAALGALASGGTREEIIAGLKTGVLAACSLVIIAAIIAHWVRPFDSESVEVGRESQGAKSDVPDVVGGKTRTKSGRR